LSFFAGNIGLGGRRLAGGVDATLIRLTIAQFLQTATQQQWMREADFEVHSPSPIFCTVLHKQWRSPVCIAIKAMQLGEHNLWQTMHTDHPVEHYLMKDIFTGRSSFKAPHLKEMLHLHRTCMRQNYY